MPGLRRFLSVPARFARDSRRQGSIAITEHAPHLRDSMNLDRAMNWVVVALVPCILMALFNTGYQANVAMAELGLASAPGWRGFLLEAFGIGYEPSGIWATGWHGALYYLPVLAVAALVGFFWEQLFATLRRRDRAPGLLVIALLFSLSLPPTIPLWQVALGMSFGIVVAKEVFGGTGKNFLNPALAALAFLYATYPKQMVGETAWTVVEGFTGATTMRIVAGAAGSRPPIGRARIGCNPSSAWCRARSGRPRRSLASSARRSWSPPGLLPCVSWPAPWPG